jgi:hypothetical protein
VKRETLIKSKDGERKRKKVGVGVHFTCELIVNWMKVIVVMQTRILVESNEGKSESRKRRNDSDVGPQSTITID